jgi:hypothetical protein
MSAFNLALYVPWKTDIYLHIFRDIYLHIFTDGCRLLAAFWVETAPKNALT